jgi:hypothetical protein
VTNDPLAGLDGYELTHLVAHLTAAGRLGDVHRLLALDRVVTEPVPELPGWLDNLRRRRRTQTVERNAWNSAHESAANATGYLADIAIVRERADGLGLELRYALIEATIRGRDQSIPAELVVAMVTTGLWTTDDGISHAGQLPFPDRPKAMAALLPRLPAAERATALARELAAAQAAPNAEHRATSLRLLAPHVDEGRRTEVLSRSLDAIEQIGFENARTDALVASAMLLPAELVGRAMEIVRKLRSPAFRADLLVTLLPVLPAESREQAEGDALRDIELVRQAGSDRSDYAQSSALDRCVRALVKLAAWHDEPRRRKVLADAWQLSLVGRPTVSGPPLEAIPYLPEPARQHEVVHRYAEASRIGNRHDRVTALVALVPLFPGVGANMIAERAWPDVRKLRWPPWRLTAISRLIPYLREPYRTEAAECALSDLPTVGTSRQSMTEAVTALAPHLPPHLLGAALRAPWPTEDNEARALGLTALLPHLPEAEQAEILRRIEDILNSIDFDMSHTAAWVDVVERAAEPCRTRLAGPAVRAALRSSYSGHRQDALDALAAYSADAAVLRRAPAAAHRLRVLPLPVLRALVACLPPLPRRDRGAHLLEAAGRETREPRRASLLANLAENVVGTPLESRLVEEIRRFDDDFQRLIVLRRLAPRLDDATGVMADVVTALTRVADDDTVAKTVSELGTYLPDSSLPVVFGVVMEIVHEPSRATALAALASRLPGDLLDNAVADALSMGLPGRVAVLAALAPRLSDREREDVIAETVRESAQLPPMDRALLLAPLVAWLPDAVRENLIDEALRPARTPDAVTDVLLTLAVHDQYALRRLAPGLRDEEIEVVSRLAAGLDVRTGRVEILAALATRSESVEPEVVAGALRAVLAEQPTRAKLVEVIGWLHEVILKLGGQAAMVEAARAIVDVGRWWP